MNKKNILAFLTLLTITIICFSISVKMRPTEDNTKYYATGDALHQILIIDNWIDEGIYNANFTMLNDPASIEFDSFEKREKYISYPQGGAIPPFLLKKFFFSKTDTFSIIKNYAYAHLFLATFLLALTLFFFLKNQLKLTILNATILSIIPIISFTFFPYNIRFYPYSFFMNNTIPIIFIYYIFLEILRQNVNSSKKTYFINVVQALIIFYGVFTDWFFISIVFITWLVRLKQGTLGQKRLEIIRSSFLFILPVLITLIIYLTHLYFIDGFQHIINKFLIRTGVDGKVLTEKSLLKFFTEPHAILIYFYSFFIIVLIAWGILSLKKTTNNDQKNRIKKILYFSALISFPPILNTILLFQHTFQHQFSPLKFLPAIATLPFVIFPLLVIITIPRLQKIKLLKFPFLSYFLVSFVFLLYFAVVKITKKQIEQKWKNSNSITEKKEGIFIKENTTYSDVVFSTIFHIRKTSNSINFKKIHKKNKKTYASIVHSRKNVYQIASLKEIRQKVNHIKQDFTINILMPQNVGLNDETLSPLQPFVLEKIDDNKLELSLFKIDGPTFLENFYFNEIK